MVEVERRAANACSVCGRFKHHKCEQCGSTNLIGILGQYGLRDHDTMLPHECSIPASAGGSYAPASDGSANAKIKDANDFTEGGKGGGESKSVQQGNDQDDNGEANGNGSQGQANGQGKEGQGNNPLEGKNVAISGISPLGTRSVIIEMLEKAGASFHSSVGWSTDFLVNDSPTSQTVKVEAANKLGVPKITSEQLKEMLEQAKTQASQQGNNGGKGESEQGEQGEGEGGEGKEKNELRELAKALKPYADEFLDFDPDSLIKMLKELEQESTEVSTTVEIKREDGSVIEMNDVHNMMPILLRLISIRKPVYIVGPAGSGKTHSAMLAAEALALRFFPKSVGPATTEYALFGYMDAGGNYVEGIMYDPFVNGGVLLLDEMDSANPACLTALNTALSNKYCSFPNGVKQMHPDFVVIASGNTFGKGADRQYVGRNQLDAATLNRFFSLNWDYDIGLENKLAKARGGGTNVDKWVKYVHTLRGVCNELSIRMIAGTRDILEGADAVMAGFSVQEVADMRFWNSTDEDTKNRVYGRANILSRL